MAIVILKTECEVDPPYNRKVVMPEEATLMVTCLPCRTDANNMLYIKVFLDPPGSFKKNTSPSPWAIALNITVTFVSRQMLSRKKFLST